MKTFKLLFAFFLLLGFASCSDDDEGGDDSLEANRIVGEWRMQSMTIDGETVPISDCEAQSRVVFTANGNVTSTDVFEDIDSEECITEVSNEKWQYRGNNVYRFIDGTDTYEVEVLFSNNNDRFSITEEDEDFGTFTVVWVRV